MKSQSHVPDCLCVITTYRCNAECRECCFECGPSSVERLNLEDIKRVIDNATRFKSIKYIVWTGGECTLLGSDLVKGIQYAKEKGFPSRIVSNGVWAKTKTIAEEKLSTLIKAGLAELNISTGDNHQEFVDANLAILAAVTAARMGISSVISVEKTKQSKFNLDSLKNNEIYREFMDMGINTDKLKVINPVWVSFHQDTCYSYKDEDLDNSQLDRGCNNIFDFTGVDPNGNYIGCCGLTVRYIPSMNLGNVKDIDMVEAYSKQYNDFLKRWLFIEGPKRIIERAHEWNPEIEIPRFPHFCLYCSYLYNNEQIRCEILKNYKKIANDINKRFEDKIKWEKLRIKNGVVRY